MRKLCITIAGLALAGSLAACGSSSAQDYSNTDTSSVDTSVPTPAVDTYSPPAPDTSSTDTSNSVTPEMAQQLGLEICADLRGGMTQAQAWSIFQSVGLTATQGANIMAAAIQSYCPDQAP